MQKIAHSPIGIFDSGIGGLTVASAIRKLLPSESLIYFGDTAHLPYGDKSEAAIQAYSIRISDFLLSRGCKILVIACHSASSAAYELLKEYLKNKVEVVNVIDPVIRQIHSRKLGLIGTKRTIESNIYKKKLGNDIDLLSLATPLLAPMIEEGFFRKELSQQIIDEYLNTPGFDSIDGLVLGCTHYPLIRSQIEQWYQHKITIYDPSELTAQEVKDRLERAGTINQDNVNPGNQFFVSDYTQSFEASTKLFFGERINLELCNLWD